VSKIVRPDFGLEDLTLNGQFHSQSQTVFSLFKTSTVLQKLFFSIDGDQLDWENDGITVSNSPAILESRDQKVPGSDFRASSS
jgi:hypothetical protein